LVDILAIAVAAVVLWPIAHDFVRRRFDLYDYWNWFALGVLVLLLQYVQAREWIFWRFGEEQAAYAFGLLLVSVVLFRVGYGSPVGRQLAAKLPAVPRNSPRPIMMKWGVILVLLGIMGQAVFVGRSGGFEEYFSVPRGGGDYEHNTAYLYGMLNFVYLGLLILISEGRKRTVSPFTRLMILLLVLLVLLYKVYIGQRSHVILYSICFLAVHYSSRGRSIPWRVLVSYGLTLSLVIGFMSLYRLQIHLKTDWGALSRDIAQRTVWDFLEAAPRGGTMVGYGTEICMYVGITYFVPDPVPYDYGANYLNLLVQWIPRKLWPSRPHFGMNHWLRLLEAQGSGATHGPTKTLFGGFYGNGGVVGVIALSLVYGVVMAIMPCWRRLYQSNDFVRLAVIGLMFEPWFWVLGGGIPGTIVARGPWFIAPMVLIYVWLRARFPLERRAALASGKRRASPPGPVERVQLGRRGTMRWTAQHRRPYKV